MVYQGHSQDFLKVNFHSLFNSSTFFSKDLCFPQSKVADKSEGLGIKFSINFFSVLLAKCLCK